MRPDPATPFADLLPAVETGNLVRVEVEAVPGPKIIGPAGMATYEGVVVEVLNDSGSPDGPGRYFRSFRLLNDSENAAYRFDYRGTTTPRAYLRAADGQTFDGNAAWGTRRRVYSFEVDGKGITARRERAGYSFGSVPTDDEDYE